jgi:hypothetical protein
VNDHGSDGRLKIKSWGKAGTPRLLDSITGGPADWQLAKIKSVDVSIGTSNKNHFTNRERVRLKKKFSGKSTGELSHMSII